MSGMVPLGFLLLLCLTSVLSLDGTTYLAVIPATLNYPSSQAVCVQFTGVLWPIKLTVHLKTQRRTQELHNSEVKPGQLLRCTWFKVPDPSGVEEVATVLVRGSQGIRPFEESKTVLIQRKQKGTFLQTDKPVYNAGQSVNFRVVTLDDDFIPQNDKYESILVQDPSGNRLVQWVNVTPQQGIADLSFPLSLEAALGTYSINVGPRKTSATFTVEDYVLQHFEVTFGEPSFISIRDTVINIQVCGRYTYGKPVHGRVNGTLCQKPHNYCEHQPPSMDASDDVCQTFEGRTGQDGCFSTRLNTTIYNFNHWSYQPLEAKAILAEDRTGIMEAGERNYQVSFVAATAKFQAVENHYIPGVPFTGQIKVVDASGDAMMGQGVRLQGNGVSQEHLTDNEGLISFSLNTSGWDSSEVYLQAIITRDPPGHDPGVIRLYYQDAHLSLVPLFSSISSWMKIQPPEGTMSCNQTKDIQVNYKLDAKDLRPGATYINFYYYITGRKGVVSDGMTAKSINKEDCKGNKEPLQGTFSIKVTFNRLFAPFVRLLVFALFPNKGITADSVVIDVSRCFRNKVELAFSAPENLPGSDVTVTLRAAPNSLCALRAVDTSVLLRRPAAELSSETIYDAFFPMDRCGYPYEVSEGDSDRCPHYKYSLPSVDVHSLFEEAGLKVFTNSNIRKPMNCRGATGLSQSEPTMSDDDPGMEEPALMAGANMETVRAPEPSIQDRVMQYFPETWIWDLQCVGPSGHQDFSITLPDTINEWKAMTFCTSDVGFGLSPTVSVKTFKPFFSELTSPSSVVRGEGFTLKATVFNYLHYCIEISAHLLPPCSGFETPRCDCHYTICLQSKETHTFSWAVKPTELGKVNFNVIIEAVGLCGPQNSTLPNKGRKETLTRSVHVQAEGIAQERTHSFMLCSKKTAVSEEVSLSLPPGVISGSEKAHVYFSGDPMASALQNLDNLIHTPSRCGERNMLTFASLVYTLQYLENTGQLTDDIWMRTYTYLQTGYQQQLNYKHSDGSHSACGKEDVSGSPWWTAFVAKSLFHAEEFISIDEEVVDTAVAWLQHRQSKDGCFMNVGGLYHTTMKGGAEYDVSLSAYITSALLEIGWPLQDPVMEEALQCLRKHNPAHASTYTMALLFYTFTLAGDWRTRYNLAEELEERAIKSGGEIHWINTSRGYSDDDGTHSVSADVETTAYVLLGYLSIVYRSQIDIQKAVAIVSWLSRQQNVYGGFSSTQDTVVALQAMAKYAAPVHRDKPDVTVNFSGPNNFFRTFAVNDAKPLGVQQAPLIEIPGNYTVSAVGHGCAFVQMMLVYNILTPIHSSSFNLSIDSFLICPIHCDVVNLFIAVHVSGSRHETNMVLIEIQMPSGFYPPETVKQELMSRDFVQQVELSHSSVIIYLQRMDYRTHAYSFTTHQELVVDNLQPATVKVYDYLKPGERAEMLYTPINRCQATTEETTMFPGPDHTTTVTTSALQSTVEPTSPSDNTVEPTSTLESTLETTSPSDNTVEPSKYSEH
ncbi:alpha-2-macroglobulin-like protein 1 [Pleurodeles waltl]|uniref:alpha-2-macroglobulin-like protein 1 n=1 Tax=Pleurodeles waltl TaxID=8319 RepID=UPI00370947FC